MIPSDYCIKETCNIADALKKLDVTGRHCLFVVSDESKLLASLTDGDVRRYILKTGSIDGVASDAANYSPQSLRKGEEDSVQRKGSALSAIPILDDAGNISDILFSDSSVVRRRDTLSEAVPVVMMAGGVGSRLLPLTAIIPKPLIPINGKTIAERIIESFSESGCNDFYLVLNYKKEIIKAYFDGLEKSYSIDYVDEFEYCGTGGGLKLLEKTISSTFFLTNCDILINADLKELVALHKREGNAITIVCSLKSFLIPYGTIDLAEGGVVGSMNEKPTLNYFINTGCYVVEPEVISYIGEKESIDFPDLIDRCRNKDLRVGVYPISEGAWLDMGQVSEMKNMINSLKEH